MAAGDLTLRALLLATDLMSPTVVAMADTFDASVGTMGASAVALNDAVLTGVAALEQAGARTEAAAAAMDTLSESSAAAGGYLASLGDQVFTTGVGFDGLAASADAADASLAGINASAVSADASLASMGATADTSAASVDTVTASADAGAAGLNGLKMAAGAFLLIGAVAAGVSVKMAADFQQGITQLETGAGELHSNLATVSQGILDMAVATGTSTKQLTDGMFMIESAGFRGANGLKVLQAAAEGARVGNADLGTTANAVTTVMKDYGMGANQAGSAMNFLTAVVQNGKTHLQDLAQSMSTVLPAASAVGVHLIDVGAAMATMTGEGVPAANAATYLRQMLVALDAPASAGKKALDAIGLTTQQVSDSMKKSLPGALQMIMTHLAETYKVGSPQYVNALKNIAGGSKQMQGMLDLTGTHMKDFEGNVTSVSGVMNKGKGSIVGWTAVQQDFNFKADQAKQALSVMAITIGTQLLPPLTQIVTAITPVVVSFTQWADSMMHNQTAMAIFGGILAGLAAIVLFAVVPAIISMGVAMLTAEIMGAPIILIVLAIIAVVTAVILVIQHWGAIMTWFGNVFSAIGTFVHNVLSAMGTWFGTVFSAIGTTVRDALTGIKNFFGNIFSAIGTTVHNALTGIKNFFGNIFSSIGTFFHNFWNGIISFLKGALATLVTIVTAPFHAIGQLFTWLYNHNYYIKALCDAIVNFFHSAIAWIQQAWTTIVNWLVEKWNGLKTAVGNIFSAIGTFLHDKLTAIAQFFQSIWNNITSWLTSKWNDLKNLAGNAFSALGTLVQSKITALAIWMYTTWEAIKSNVVSKVTDLKNMVGNAFSALGTDVHDKVTGLWNWLVGFANGWPAQAFNWGKNLIQGIINGIMNMIGAVKNAVGQVAGAIGNFLGFHSPAKEGPGREADKWAPAFVNMYVAGLHAGMPKVNAALTQLTTPTTANKNAFALQGGSSASGSGGYGVMNLQINLDGKVLTEVVSQRMAKETRINGYRSK